MLISAPKMLGLKIGGFSLLHHNNSGQALIELAVFGAIFLVLLSALIRYGMEYNLQQKTQMVAFRRAMAMAGTSEGGVPRGGGRYALSQQMRVPDITTSQNGGVMITGSGSASVVRDPLQHYTKDTPDSIIVDSVDSIDVDSSGQTKSYKRLVSYGSGYRYEHNVPVAAMPKYLQVYSDVIVRGSGGGWTFYDKSKDVDSYATSCLHYTTTTLSGGYGGGSGMTITVCDSYALDEIRIGDSCIGNMPNYAACYDQSTMLVDAAYCTTRCRRINDCDNLRYSERSNCRTNCSTDCALRTNPPNQNDSSYNDANGGAWYAANWYSAGTRNYPVDGPKTTYVFPVLEQLFSGSTTKSFGPGGDGRTVLSHDERQVFHKHETPTQIVTEEDVLYRDVTHMNKTTLETLDEGGTQIPTGTNVPGDYATRVRSVPFPMCATTQMNQTWRTNK